MYANRKFHEECRRTTGAYQAYYDRPNRSSWNDHPRARSGWQQYYENYDDISSTYQKTYSAPRRPRFRDYYTKYQHEEDVPSLGQARMAYKLRKDGFGESGERGALNVPSCSQASGAYQGGTELEPMEHEPSTSGYGQQEYHSGSIVEPGNARHGQYMDPFAEANRRERNLLHSVSQPSIARRYNPPYRGQNAEEFFNRGLTPSGGWPRRRGRGLTTSQRKMAKEHRTREFWQQLDSNLRRPEGRPNLDLASETAGKCLNCFFLIVVDS